MNIISIDPSKYSTGVYVKTQREECSFLITNKKNTTQEIALIKIHTVFSDFFKKNHIDIGLIEGYGFNPKNKRSVTVLCEIVGVIRMVFAEYDIPLITIPIMTWKKLTIGNKISKSKNKNKYLEMVNKKYGKEFSCTDNADAYMIYVATKEIAKQTKNITPTVKKVREELKRIIRG